MKHNNKKTFFVIIGLLLFYIPVKLLGDVVQQSYMPLRIAYPIYFLLGAVSVIVIWVTVRRLDY